MNTSTNSAPSRSSTSGSKAIASTKIVTASGGASGSSKPSSKPRSRPKSFPAGEIERDCMEQVTLWLDGLSLSRSRSELALVRMERDFADGYLIAELIAKHHPKLVEMHNYSRGCSAPTKRNNWLHLRRKVLNKLNIEISDEQMELIIEARPGAIDRVLKAIHIIAMNLEAQKREAEEEKARANADPLPLEDWKQDVCFMRKDPKGQREFMIQGKVMVEKDVMTQEVEKRDLELTQLKTTNDQLRAQVARLQMTVDLKEDRLGELTHQLSIFQRQEPKAPLQVQQSDKVNNSPIPPGPGGDARKPTNKPLAYF